ncbi:DUF1648 domain-containing protein [Alicyclobacillus acidocaldarius]|uniref:DUF1648 domain-containing protein n=1 Tax=Alicyclobacillus acidocaldarius TaxID=405212 RepID=UPI0002E1869A|nr:DUF1648 domain-containing protein [Alicyclobacillus acidocaldarius]
MPSVVGYQPPVGEVLQEPSLWICVGMAVLLITVGLFWRRVFLERGVKGFATAFWLLLACVPFLLAVNIIVSGLRSGWRLAGGVLQVRTDAGVTAVDLARAHAAWVTQNGVYGLADRLLGTNAGAYASGLFRLNNGQVAHVYVLAGAPRLAVSDGHALVILGTPGLDALVRHVSMGVVPAVPPTSVLPFHPVAGLVTLVVSAATLLVHVAMWHRYRTRVPDRVTSHWDVSGRPNGQMSRAGFYRWGLGVAIGLGILLTFVSCMTWVGCVLGALVEVAIALLWRMVWRVNTRPAHIA